MAWVTLAELRDDIRSAPAGAVEDARLQKALDAAVAEVEVARSDLDFVTPAVPANVKLGTLRLAARWYRRGHNAQSQITAELGLLGALPYSDPDIDRLLGLGKWSKPVIA